MRNILILGGAGFVGSNLVRRCLLEPNTAVTVVDLLLPDLKSSRDNLDDVLDEIDFREGDTRDRDFLKELVKGKDVVFNLAAQTSHSLSMDNPILDAEINCIGTLNVLEAVKKFNPGAVIVYSSSSSLIGRSKAEFIDEEHPEKPLDIYSANKGVAEKYHYIFSNAFGLKTISLRFANLYGPFGKKEPIFGFINHFIHLANAGMPITIYGTGEQKRNVMFIDDAVEILWLAANNPNLFGSAYFAAHYDHHSVREVAEAIADVFDTGVDYIPWPDLRKKIEIDDVNISSKRLYDEAKWRPKYSLLDGLAMTKNRIRL